MNDETVPTDAWSDDDEVRPSFGAEIDAYLEAVGPGELGAAWWLRDNRAAVSFTARVEEHRQALESLIGRENVVVRVAEYSGAELRAVRDQIASALFGEPGGPLTMVDLDEVAGRVTVGVLNLDDDARTYVHQRWPHPAVRVEQVGRFRAL